MGSSSRFLESPATEEKDSDYIGVRFIGIDSNGSESIYAS